MPNDSTQPAIPEDLLRWVATVGPSAIADRIARLETSLAQVTAERDEALNRHVQFMVEGGPVVMASDHNKALAQLAECYRLTGADPDGNEDWRLADKAVRAVQEFREEFDKAEAENERLKAPVSDEEWKKMYCHFHDGEMTRRKHVDALLSQRERSK